MQYRGWIIQGKFSDVRDALDYILREDSRPIPEIKVNSYSDHGVEADAYDFSDHFTKEEIEERSSNRS